MSQRSNNTEIVVPTITLEGQALKELFVITIISLDVRSGKVINQRFQPTHVASTNEASDQSIQFTTEELDRFHLYQESLKSPSTPITAITKSSNPNKCLVSSSSSEWIIDSRATNQMTGNSSLFSTFQSQLSTSTATLADGSQSCVLESDTIFPTPSLSLSSVLSFPNFSFNLMSVSKITPSLSVISHSFLIFASFEIL